MIRKITTHEINDCNREIQIYVDDDPESGGPPSRYMFKFPDSCGELNNTLLSIQFQKGDPKVSVNGFTNEVFLAILIDRIEAFQSGKFACEENQIALTHLRLAFRALHRRTLDRIRRGVEGSQTP